MAVRSAQALTQRVQRGAMWSGLNTITLKVANILITAITVRLVSPHDFGVFAVAVTVFAVVSSVSELGLSSCISRADMEPDDVAPTVAALALANSVILASAMYLFAEPLGTWLGAAEASAPIRVLAVSVLLSGITAVPTAQLIREFRQDILFATTAISFTPANLSLILLAAHGDGAMAFAVSRLVGQIVAATFVIYKVKTRYWPNIDKLQVGRVLRFGLPLAGANLLNYILLNADYALIGKRLGAALLGIYMLAFNVAGWATSVLSSTVNGVAVPAFSRIKTDEVRLRLSVARSARVVGAVAFPISALTVALASPIIHTLYGSKWQSASPVLSILAVYGSTFVVSLLFANLLVGIGHAGRLFFIQSAWIVILIPAMLLGMEYDGLRGVAIAHVLVLLGIVIPLYGIALRSTVRNTPALLMSALLTPAICACLAGVIARLAILPLSQPQLQLVVGLFAGGLTYLALSIRWITGVCGDSLTRHLPRRLRRAITHGVETEPCDDPELAADPKMLR